MFSGSKYPKNILFYFEKRSTVWVFNSSLPVNVDQPPQEPTVWMSNVETIKPLRAKYIARTCMIAWRSPIIDHWCTSTATSGFTQWLFFGRNIGQLTPKNIYFHYRRKCFLDQSIQKIFYLILKKEALASPAMVAAANCKPVLWLTVLLFSKLNIFFWDILIQKRFF